MKQAKVLTDAEMKRLLAVIANDRHSERNRLAVMLSHFAGLRVGEVASPYRPAYLRAKPCAPSTRQGKLD